MSDIDEVEENVGDEVSDDVIKVMDLVKTEDTTELLALLNADAERAPHLVTSLDQNGWSAFTMSAELGNEEIVRFLLDLKVDVNASNFTGNAPLHCALANGFSEIGKLLIDAGADLNAPDKENWFPIHYACEQGLLEIVQCLIAHANLPASPCEYRVRQSRYCLPHLRHQKSAPIGESRQI